MKILNTIVISLGIGIASLIWINYKQRKKKKHVLIFGSSMNPPTKSGHYALIKHYSKMYDEIWILPVYKHIYTSKSSLISFNHRYKMSQLTFKSIKNCYVKSIEKDVILQNATSTQIGTIDVVKYIQKVYDNV